MAIVKGGSNRKNPVISDLSCTSLGHEPIIWADVISSSLHRLHLASNSGSTPVRTRCLLRELCPVMN